MKIKKKDSIIDVINNPDKYDPEMVLRANLILQLIELREKRHMNQSDVAEKLGISHQAVAKFESMSNSPTLVFAMKYAEAVNGTLDIKVKAKGKRKK